MARTPTDGERKSGTPVAMRESLKKAVTEMLVLFMVKQRPMYTYEMMQYIKDMSGGVLTFNTLYQAIYRLVSFGYVEEIGKRVSDDNRVRVYFGITPAGLEYLPLIMQEYRAVTGVVDHILSMDGRLEGET